MIMTDFVSQLKNNGAFAASGATDRALELAQNSLQQMRAAMLPMQLIEFFKAAGGMALGDACIFGPSEFSVRTEHPTPNIVNINREITNLAGIRGKTVFGRNALFWFAVDAFGNSYLLDNLNLNPLRKYENDVFKAISDCLAAGKI